MPKKTQDLRQFLIEEMQDLYDAEKQLVRALPRMAKAASNEDLRNAITEHQKVTQGQVERLEQCFEHLEQKAKSKPCKGMRGILEEGQEMLKEDMEDAVMDAAIAASGRKIEHYEMVAYESLRAIAEQLELREVAELLGETLEEEQQTDQELLEICQQVVEESASGAEMEEDEGEEAGEDEGEEGPKGGRGRQVSTQAAGKTAKQTGARGASRGASGKASGGGGQAHSGRVLTDTDEIREWAEERGAKPSCVKGTMKGDGSCMLRLDFPGYSGEDSLEEIDWDQWAEQFERSKLALIVDDKTAGGQRSNFNKLVSRETASKARPKTRAAH